MRPIEFNENGNTSKVYEARSGAIQRMIDQRVVQDAADAAGVTREQLLANEMTKRGRVTDEEISAFYDSHSDQLGGATLEQVSPRIRDHLKQQRSAEVMVSLTPKVLAISR